MVVGINPFVMDSINMQVNEVLVWLEPIPFKELTASINVTMIELLSKNFNIIQFYILNGMILRKKIMIFAERMDYNFIKFLSPKTADGEDYKRGPCRIAIFTMGYNIEKE